MKNGRVFKLLYCLFLVCSVVYVKQHFVSFLTLRQLMAVVMFVLCAIEDRHFQIDKYFKLYIGFIICYGLSAIATGYFNDFILRLIGDFFVAFVMYWSTKLLCQKYDGINALVWTVMIVGSFDAVVTSFQALGIHRLDPIINAFNLISYENLESWQSSRDDLMGLAIPGIVSHPVVNGQFLLFCFVLSIIGLGKGMFNRIVGFISTAILFIGIFFCQQRAAFVLAIFIFLYLLYKRVSTRQFQTKWFLVIVVTMVLLTVIPQAYDLLMTGNNRYAELGMDSSGRDRIFSQAWHYYLEHPIFGGYRQYCDEYVYPPHNFILNTLLAGGFLGGFFMFAMVFLQFKEIVKSCLKKNEYFVKIVAGMTFVALIGNGMMHNVSLMNGDVMTWVAWGIFLYCDKKTL